MILTTRRPTPAILASVAVLLAGCGADERAAAPGAAETVIAAAKALAPSARPSAGSNPATASGRRVLRRRFAVGLRTITIVDPRRHVRIPGRGVVRRTLVTIVRYPAVGPTGRVDLVRAAPDRSAGPFPLVVFGHGFAVTPAIYARLLRAWAVAGYVVAAPVFPLENANAPGGPNESDIVNQPADMSLVISRMLALSDASGGPFGALVDSRSIAVAGQSDGGETALAVADYPGYADPRVDAAVILSGANIGTGRLVFPTVSPPLLAAQGTADLINPPSRTSAFFDIAPSPKYLLTLIGASHLDPYTTQQPQLGIVERTSTAFLDRYLKNAPGASAALLAAGDRPGISVVHADP
ncbi:MAG TPA: hypothetical protein VG165_11350 [Solirubrobacteraceae bacterium]|jgi:dienelactone hydrolase|nr:hypothetical protein [Solirubrobacteraceae bacterium]